MKNTLNIAQTLRLTPCILALFLALGCRSPERKHISVIKKARPTPTKTKAKEKKPNKKTLSEQFAVLSDEDFEVWLQKTLHEDYGLPTTLSKPTPTQAAKPKTRTAPAKPTKKTTLLKKAQPKQKNQVKDSKKKAKIKTKISPTKKTKKRSAPPRKKKKIKKPIKKETKRKLSALKTKKKTSSKQPIIITPPVVKQIPAPKEPRLRAGLLLDIQVTSLGQTEIDVKSIRIASDGLLNLPVLGSVNTGNMNLNEFTDHLTTRYSEYLRNTRVEVKFVFDKTDAATSPWGYVTVLGQVAQAGRVTLPASGQMTVSMAIQEAGGFDTSAKKKAIIVTRKENGKLIKLKVNLKTLGKKGNTDNDISLRPGDQIYVPEYFF